MSNDSIVDHILQSEGWPTFTNHPKDRGGPTKGGITLKTLRSYGGHPIATETDLRNLSEADARKIYEYSYITVPGFALIEDGLLRFQVVDAGVLSGPSRATRWLQEVVGVAIDGRLGPVTAAAVNTGNAHSIALKFCAIRARGLMRIVSKDHTQAVWAGGWMNRAMSFLDREAERHS